MAKQYEELPEPIDAMPEVIAEVVLSMPPKREWRYLKRQRERREARQRQGVIADTPPKERGNSSQAEPGQ